MKTMTLAAALVSSLIAGTSAFATQTAEQNVTWIDRETLTMRLSDGEIYNVPNRASLVGLRVGDRVWISFDEVGDERSIRGINPTEDFH